MKMPIDEFLRLPEWQREEIRQLVRAHGFDTNETFDVEYSVVDAPMLTVWVYEKNDEGRFYLSRGKPGDPDAEIAHHTVDVLLRHPLPEWWRE